MAVLWIDDQATALDAFCWHMEHEGFKILVASGNDEALALMKEYRGQIDIVIQDGMR